MNHRTAWTGRFSGFSRFQTGSIDFLLVRLFAGFQVWPDRIYDRFNVWPVRSSFDNLNFNPGRCLFESIPYCIKTLLINEVNKIFIVKNNNWYMWLIFFLVKKTHFTL
jgi:hypothetical protein